MEVVRDLGVEASDVTGQKVHKVPPFERDALVGHLVDRMLERMRLPKNDVAGRPLVYHARLEREGRHLHASEKVSDALQTGDRLVLQPDIEAGLS